MQGERINQLRVEGMRSKSSSRMGVSPSFLNESGIIQDQMDTFARWLPLAFVPGRASLQEGEGQEEISS
jgi:hypothetical protein